MRREKKYLGNPVLAVDHVGVALFAAVDSL
jgi:hypothetical protein